MKKKEKTSAEMVEEAVTKDPVVKSLQKIKDGVHRGCLADNASEIIGKKAHLIFLKNKLGVACTEDFDTKKKEVHIRIMMGIQKGQVLKLKCDPAQLFDVVDLAASSVLALSLSENIME